MIRQVSPRDARALGKIFCFSWKAAYRGIVPDAHLDAMTVRSCTPKEIDPAHLLVAEEGGAVVGLVRFGAVRDEGMGEWGEVRAIYVLPESWGGGHGRALLEGAAQELRRQGYGKFYLWVLKDNARARAFYERMGMKNACAERTINIGGKDIWEVRYERGLQESV